MLASPGHQQPRCSQNRKDFKYIHHLIFVRNYRKCSMALQKWNGNVIPTKSSPLAAPEVAKMTPPVHQVMKNSSKWHQRFNESLRRTICHYSDVIMSAMASQITGVSIVYLTVSSGADQRKHQISASLHGLCAGNSPVTGGFPSQRASNAENISIWWRHHDFVLLSLASR